MWRTLKLSAGLIAILAVVGALVVRHLLVDPTVVLLLPKGGASWVRADRPFDLLGHRGALTFAAFATPFTVPPGGSGAVALEVTALRRVAVSVDGRRIFDTGADASDWHRVWSVPLPPLSAGTHQLRLDVANRNGPSLVRAACPSLGLLTGSPRWRATDDPKRPPTDWPAAVPADRPWEPALAANFDPAATAVRQLAPLLIVLFLAGATACLAAARRASRGAVPVDWGRWVRWGVLIAWVVLAGNNLTRVPPYVGYDVLDHVAYVKAVAQTWLPPLPNAGWETFHPPLYYFCSAVLYRAALACGATVEGATSALRLIPLACGAAMVEWCYRSARRVFPGRTHLHAVAAVVGGLLPMNLYMGQAVSNEPLSACLDAGLTVLCLGLIRPDAGDVATTARWVTRLAVTGLVLGLAILTKLSGLVWAGPVAGAVVVAAVRRCRARGPSARWGWVGAPAVVLGVAGVVCGWYFVRNQVAIGVPFLSHSTVGRTLWWQDPGYRTPAQFLTFGRALARPVYGDLTGIWDDLYATLWSDGMLNGVLTFEFRPPWHYGLMSCGLWLGLLPTAAIAAGTARAILGRCPATVALRFAAATIGLFVLALLYLCLTWPIYSDVKASYLLGVTPCLALLAAAGVERAMVRPWSRAAVVGLLTCWATTAYLTYFVTA